MPYSDEESDVKSVASSQKSDTQAPSLRRHLHLIGKGKSTLATLQKRVQEDGIHDLANLAKKDPQAIVPLFDVITELPDAMGLAQLLHQVIRAVGVASCLGLLAAPEFLGWIYNYFNVLSGWGMLDAAYQSKSLTSFLQLLRVACTYKKLSQQLLEEEDTVARLLWFLTLKKVTMEHNGQIVCVLLNMSKATGTVPIIQASFITTLDSMLTSEVIIAMDAATLYLTYIIDKACAAKQNGDSEDGELADVFQKLKDSSIPYGVIGCINSCTSILSDNSVENEPVPPLPPHLMVGDLMKASLSVFNKREKPPPPDIQRVSAICTKALNLFCNILRIVFAEPEGEIAGHLMLAMCINSVCNFLQTVSAELKHYSVPESNQIHTSYTSALKTLKAISAIQGTSRHQIALENPQLFTSTVTELKSIYVDKGHVLVVAALLKYIRFIIEPEHPDDDDDGDIAEDIGDGDWIPETLGSLVKLGEAVIDKYKDGEYQQVTVQNSGQPKKKVVLAHVSFERQQTDIQAVASLVSLLVRFQRSGYLPPEGLIETLEGLCRSYEARNGKLEESDIGDYSDVRSSLRSSLCTARSDCSTYRSSSPQNSYRSHTVDRKEIASSTVTSVVTSKPSTPRCEYTQPQCSEGDKSNGDSERVDTPPVPINPADLLEEQLSIIREQIMKRNRLYEEEAVAHKLSLFQHTEQVLTFLHNKMARAAKRRSSVIALSDHKKPVGLSKDELALLARRRTNTIPIISETKKVVLQKPTAKRRSNALPITCPQKQCLGTKRVSRKLSWIPSCQVLHVNCLKKPSARRRRTVLSLVDPKKRTLAHIRVSCIPSQQQASVSCQLQGYRTLSYEDFRRIVLEERSGRISVSQLEFIDRDKINCEVEAELSWHCSATARKAMCDRLESLLNAEDTSRAHITDMGDQEALLLLNWSKSIQFLISEQLSRRSISDHEDIEVAEIYETGRQQESGLVSLMYAGRLLLNAAYQTRGVIEYNEQREYQQICDQHDPSLQVARYEESTNACYHAIEQEHTLRTSIQQEENEYRCSLHAQCTFGSDVITLFIHEVQLRSHITEDEENERDQLLQFAAKSHLEACLLQLLNCEVQCRHSLLEDEREVFIGIQLMCAEQWEQIVLRLHKDEVHALQLDESTTRNDVMVEEVTEVTRMQLEASHIEQQIRLCLQEGEHRLLLVVEEVNQFERVMEQYQQSFQEAIIAYYTHLKQHLQTEENTQRSSTMKVEDTQFGHICVLSEFSQNTVRLCQAEVTARTAIEESSSSTWLSSAFNSGLRDLLHQHYARALHNTQQQESVARLDIHKQQEHPFEELVKQFKHGISTIQTNERLAKEEASRLHMLAMKKERDRCFHLEQKVRTKLVMQEFKIRSQILQQKIALKYSRVTTQYNDVVEKLSRPLKSATTTLAVPAAPKLPKFEEQEAAVKNSEGGKSATGSRSGSMFEDCLQFEGLPQLAALHQHMNMSVNIVDMDKYVAD